MTMGMESMVTDGDENHETRESLGITKVKCLDNKGSRSGTMWKMAFSIATIAVLFLCVACVDAPPMPCSLRSMLEYTDITGFLNIPGFLGPGLSVIGKCKTGYIPKEKILIKCNTVDGRPVLSPQSPCQVVTCKPVQDKDGGQITIENISEATDNITYKYRDLYTPSCKDGYTYKGPPLKCDENGEFAGDLGTCERVTCPPPYAICPEGTSILNATGNKFGDVVFLKQNRGYECSGLTNFTCGADGQWTRTTNITCTFLYEERFKPGSAKPDTNNNKWSDSTILVFVSGIAVGAMLVAMIVGLVRYYKFRGQNSYNCTNTDGSDQIQMTVQMDTDWTAKQDTPLIPVEQPKKEDSENDVMSAPPSAFYSEEVDEIESPDEVKQSRDVVMCVNAEQGK